MHFYTSGSLPLDIWGKEGIVICTVWNNPPNTPIMLWGVPHNIWESLEEKGAEIALSFFAGEGTKFTMSLVQPSDWGVN
jgi:hypothetical protein